VRVGHRDYTADGTTAWMEWSEIQEPHSLGVIRTILNLTDTPAGGT